MDEDVHPTLQVGIFSAACTTPPPPPSVTTRSAPQPPHISGQRRKAVIRRRSGRARSQRPRHVESLDAPMGDVESGAPKDTTATSTRVTRGGWVAFWPCVDFDQCALL